jgi:hypothetical protein
MEGRAKILGAAMPANTHERLKQYRCLAEEARQHAAQARSFDDQSDWMQIAEEWEQLAILVEQQEKSLLQNEGGRSTDNSKQAAL